jgi:hypothetical protein
MVDATVFVDDTFSQCLTYVPTIMTITFKWGAKSAENGLISCPEQIGTQIVKRTKAGLKYG